MGNPMIVHERSVSGCKVSEKGSEGAQYHENHIGIRRGPRTRDTCDFELEKVNTRSARWRGMSLLYRCADSTRAGEILVSLFDSMDSSGKKDAGYTRV
ncbi:uncharacterized protein LOC122566686 isoform X6 [Bombus pyrosoma]|uniref:uncharacterized protein LOC122566686 isoform X6 n=1 Tax=Bombus pyrosoma TaxID=396416 RepID=UPI001CB9B5E2|nr:uncharacterized protein LOC122566686 isoform X6 [Bombus pyrosoma]